MSMDSNLLSKMRVLIGVQLIKIRHLIKKRKREFFPSNFNRVSLSFFNEVSYFNWFDTY